MTLAIACGPTRPSSLVSPASPTQPTLPPAVASHLNEILDLMQRNSFNRGAIDWPAFRAAVMEAASSAQSVSELGPAVLAALRLLDDGHSFYRSATNAIVAPPRPSCATEPPPTIDAPGAVGVVRITSFSGTPDAGATYAAAVHATIASQDRDSLVGWIVDLRGNAGGNMWPMLAGTGPILGGGPVGYFVGATGNEIAWEYRDGAAFLGASAQARVPMPYRLRRSDPRVAVITDRRVASSGEAVAIAFRGRPNTRSFGQSTCGQSTANTTYVLADGAQLNLTTAVMADRLRQRYGGPVIPDEITPDHATTVRRAIDWLLTGR